MQIWFTELIQQYVSTIRKKNTGKNKLKLDWNLEFSND